MEADQLLILISPLRHRLPAHLQALWMLLTFDTNVEQIRSALTAACDCATELRTAECIPRLLSCGLALVNVLNAANQPTINSTTVEVNRPVRPKKPVIGFEVNNLVRLADTKDSTNQRNLVYYLAELMEMK